MCKSSLINIREMMINEQFFQLNWSFIKKNIHVTCFVLYSTDGTIYLLTLLFEYNYWCLHHPH